MTNNPVPFIKVEAKVKKISNENPLIRDVICLIGGFETKLDEEDNTNIDKPVFYETLEDAEADLYDGSETTTPDANLALRQIFHEQVSGVLVVNISTFTGSTTKTWSRDVTEQKLKDALASVADINFDLLYVASELSDTLLTAIKDDTDDRFEAKKPYGYIGVGTRNSTTAYNTTAGKMGDNCYAFLTQPLEVNDTALSLVESGAYLTNLIARLPVGNSLTAKVLDEVTDIGEVTGLNQADDYTALVHAGFFVVRLIDALNKTFECVNSATANGLDLYINRVRDYIVNDFALREYLGERNNQATISGIEMECNRLLNKFRSDLGLVENITYAVERASPECVNIILNTIEFSGVITEIDVFITIEVI